MPQAERGRGAPGIAELKGAKLALLACPGAQAEWACRSTCSMGPQGAPAVGCTRSPLQKVMLPGGRYVLRMDSPAPPSSC